MANTAHFQPNEQRRRSTRIAQTLPLTVRGMDLLGQPFEERTSTMVFNLHGCRYASKHHLPKNTWITLEVPGRESAAGANRVRARVAWVQRPHTVRELFQIAVELENPNNIWGLNSPPDDWTLQASTTSGKGADGGTRAEEISPLPILDAAPASGNMETAGSLSTLTNFMEKLLASTQKVAEGGGSHSALSSHMRFAVEAESPLLRELRAQLEQQAVKAVENATAKASEEIHRTAERTARKHSESAEAFYQRWREEFEHASSSAREQLSTELAERIAATQKEVRARLETDLEKNLGQGRELISEIESRAQSLHSEIGSAEAATARLTQIRLEVEELAASHEQRLKGLAESVEEKGAGETLLGEWRQRLEGEMEVARGQWGELLQSSLDSAAQRLVARLAEVSQTALESAERQLASRLADLREPADEAVAEARESLAGVKSSLGQELERARTSLLEIEQAAGRIKAGSAQFEAATQDAINQLQRNVEKILNTQTAEMNRRAEALAGGLVQRAAPALDAAAQQFVTRAMADLQAKLAPQLDRSAEILRELSAREGQAEESLRLHRERLRQASEINRKEFDSVREGALTELRNSFEMARKDALTKWGDELDSAGVRATHAAAESMGKSSEWQLQQAQSRMQSLVEDSLRAAGGALEKTAAAAIRTIESDLEKQRSAHAQQFQTQLEGTAGEVVARAGGLLEKAAEAAAASFGQVIGGISDQGVARFRESSRGAVEESSAQLERISVEYHRNFEHGAGLTIERFRLQIAGQVEQSLAEARDLLRAAAASAAEAFRGQQEGKLREWLESLEKINAESLENYKERLQTASDSWVVGAMGKLSEHGQDMIDSLKRTGEQALRNSFSRVFDGLAEMIHENLMNAAGAAAGASPGARVAANEPGITQAEKRVEN